MTAIAVRPGGGVSAATGRMYQALKLYRAVAPRKKKLRNEPEFNRKVELHRQLRARMSELVLLTDPATPMTEDTPWKNC
ncbi:hypothetical protein [Arthrobacter sp. H-02-3]|uniref:hypothetical protein n=1 Tax=Arthrobacter sp. H-02-3 TaxID=2703675 RepID=UPI000DD23218|nr:hypothetical protein [Arthrobacter sp. H-02-3]PVZ52700.1 hypothetical protein C9424_19645 [Arthrobacter sp. H-02-3]